MAARRTLAFALLGLLVVAAPAGALLGPAASAADGLLLRGTVVTMDDAGRVLEDGRVLVRDGRIVAAWSGATPPAGVLVGAAQVVDVGADARIFPGLVNLHGHPAYNVLPLWLPPASHAQPAQGRPTGAEPYGDRYQWNDPGPAEYRRLVANARSILANVGEGSDMVTHAEVMAALGGETTIEGDGPRDAVTDYTLVRNVDYGAFCAYGAPCADPVASRVSSVNDSAFLTNDQFVVHEDMATGATTSWLVHLAEGTDAASHDEFAILAASGLLAEETVVLHGTALQPADFAAMRAAPSMRLGVPGDGQGARLVWSPLSNLLLYGRTAHVHDALRAGVLVSLGTDWTPSGSRNLLDELKVADVALRDPRILGGERFLLPHAATPDEERALDATLVAMVTRNPAKTVRAWDKIGSVEAGKLADLVVLTKPARSPTGGMPDSPYRDLLDATERDVRLVLVGGEPVAGDPGIMDALKPGDHELVASSRGNFTKAVDVTDPRVPGATRTLAQAEGRLAAAMQGLGDEAWLKTRLNGGRNATESDASFDAYLRARYGEVDGRPNLEAVALNPLLVEDDPLAFALLAARLAPDGLLDAPEAPYRLYPANLNHVSPQGNAFAQDAFEDRWY